jgi:ATP-binding cassette subfamily B protein
MLTSLKLTLLVLAGLPVVLLPIILFGRRVRRLSRASQDRVADTGAYVDEAIHEIRTVQAYAHEPVDRAAYAQRVEQVFTAGVRRIRQRALLIAAVIFLVFVAVGIILWIGGHDVLAGRLSAGELSAFVFYAVVVATSIGAVAKLREKSSVPQVRPSACSRSSIRHLRLRRQRCLSSCPTHLLAPSHSMR